MAEKCVEIMRAMNPTDMRSTDELEPYNIYSYQSTHNTGGAIMGADPGHSVTNKYGQVWDTPNVFVTGAALFPQNAGYNPTGTVIALAYLASDGLKRRYFRDPGKVMG
jgi:gluconate 2-dehydrogenase alpha chain